MDARTHTHCVAIDVDAYAQADARMHVCASTHARTHLYTQQVQEAQARRTRTCIHRTAAPRLRRHRDTSEAGAHARVRAANRHAQAFHGIPVRRLLFLPPPPPPPPLLPPSAMPLHPATHSSRIRCTHARGYRSRRRGAAILPLNSPMQPGAQHTARGAATISTPVLGFS